MGINRGLSPIVILLVWLLQLASCNSKIYDLDYQHSGFLVGLEKSVGRKFSEIRNTAHRDESILGETKLPNGHIVYKYRYIRTCRYMLEVDPVTDIIVSANWKGDKGDCIHVP